MTHPLAGAHAKLDRALEHLKELDAEQGAWLRTQPYTVVAHFDFEGGEHSMRVRKVADPPAKLGLLAGDAVHNVRSALDHLVFELAGLGPDPRGDRTAWPICDTLKRFEDGRGTWLRGVPRIHWAAIESAQPYHPTFANLATLRDLDDRDKHRTITPLAAAARRAALRSEPETAVSSLRIPDKPVYLDDDAVVCWFRAEREVPVQYELQYAMVFGIPGESIVSGPELEQLVSIARRLLHHFVRAFD